ncbi:hypothetical protein [Corynebacterium nuruki]|uniref:DUF4232 domain-containing protein n=1 Tax=Corynebacterium nuruki TaxID=1032851 RepID=A0A3D4T1P6_9CORY|nr:hypothetical protein [Corynebacterium nuruki]HCT15464.1 hypothetical protein [Corynebacterium nuruki]
MTAPRNPYPDDPRPLPPEIYRRRRIAAVVVLVVVVVLIVLGLRACSGGGDGATDENAAATSSTTAQSWPASASATATSAPSTTSSGASASSSSATESASPSTSAAPEPGEACVPGDLQLAVRSGAPSYGPGENPDFYLTVTNPGDKPCNLDLGEAPLRFDVFSLGDYSRVWGDTDCNEPTSQGTTALPAGEAKSFKMSGWSRTTSAPGQCGDRAPVPAGSYLVYGHVGDAASEPGTFNLG